jgi:hypothetical protein
LWRSSPCACATNLHAQVLSREAESLLAVVRLQQRLAEEEWMGLGLTQPADDRFSTLLLTTRLRGVLALRLYEPTGQLREALPAVSDAMLPLPGLDDDWNGGRPLPDSAGRSPCST